VSDLFLIQAKPKAKTAGRRGKSVENDQVVFWRFRFETAITLIQETRSNDERYVQMVVIDESNDDDEEEGELTTKGIPLFGHREH
jgi:hypothetical protein